MNLYATLRLRLTFECCPGALPSRHRGQRQPGDVRRGGSNKGRNFTFLTVGASLWYRINEKDRCQSGSAGETMEHERNDLVNEGTIAPFDDDGEPEGLDQGGAPWGDYPIDSLLIRSENRTIYEVIRRINQSNYVMDPDFQRDFVWSETQQSKLVESVVMRIPLPVFYMAEDDQGRMVVVDGLQRLSTFRRFVADGLKLKLPGRKDLDGRRFSELAPKIKNRIEDCNIILYVIDSKVPERARLDIFERVNAGEPLTRQQMRNSLYMGPGTRFLKEEAQSDLFLKATGRSLKTKTMRDREFVNRFCAFHLLSLDDVLDRFTRASGDDGKRDAEGRHIHRDYFTGRRALFSNSSDSERRDFKHELTFPHPEDPASSLFCPWHGKVPHLTLRLHFSWPVEIGEPIYVVYAGPKITKR